jgi:hypothetical protein
MTQIYALAFLAFTLSMASKDVISRFVLTHGVPAAHLLLVAGTVAFLVAITIALVRGQKLAPESVKYQCVRILLDAMSWAFATLAFQHLNATSISIISKAYIPFLVLIGPWIGNRFSSKQKVLAWSALAAMVFFAFANRAPNEDLLGYFYLLLTTLMVSAAYIMLRHSTIKESPFIVTAVPALACNLVGGIWGAQIQMPLATSTQNFVLEIACGFLIYALYAASIYRYRVLPVGLAEYPTLLTAFFILPAEYWLFGLQPKPLYLANLALVLVLVGTCVYLNLAAKRKP